MMPEGIRTRRRSIYNFFLKHQDAMDDASASPSVQKKNMKPSETVFSLNNEKTEKTVTSPPSQTKSKRATSFVRKKPPLERGLSDNSKLRLNKNVNMGEYQGVLVLSKIE